MTTEASGQPGRSGRSHPHKTADRPAHLGDFTLDAGVLKIAALALPVGAAGALTSYCLLRLIGLITNLVFYQRISTTLVAPGATRHSALLVLLAPVAGGLAVGLMARFGSEKIRGHGMPEAIEAILVGGSRVQPRVALLKPISAAISIGTGGPFGAEGPIIMTGGAVGSILAQSLKLSADERKTLLVSGAAAGMAATFNAPLASVLLAVELLLFEWRPRSLIPVGAAVTVSVLCRGWLLGTAPVFPVADLVHPGPAAISLSLLPGITGGLLAVVATGLVYAAEDAFNRLPIHWMWWPAIGGLIIGIGGLIEPRALGVGYDVIAELLTGRAALSLVLGILIVKTLIWSLSLGSGTSGGVLAPTFMIGAALGSLEGHALPYVFPGFWAMAGLAAVVGGVMRSPLTGIVFTLELTHAWNDLLPLLVASISAYLVSALLLKRSVLTEKIARRGLHLTREYSTDALEVFFAREVMTAEPIVLRTDELLRAVLVRRAGSAAYPEPALYPIVNRDGALAGVIARHGLLAVADQASAWPERTIGELAQPPRTVVRSDQTLREVANAFALHGTTCAPVVDPRDPVRLLGMVDLGQLLHARRQDHYEEHHRQRHLPGASGGPRRTDDQQEPVMGKAVAGMTTIEIKDEREERSRYAVYLEGERIGFASCIQVHDTILLPYVEVDPERRDLGLGSMLVRRVLDDAREEGNLVVPLCPFARRWVELHPDYVAAVRKLKPGELGAMNSLVEADRTMRLLHREEPKRVVVALDPETT